MMWRMNAPIQPHVLESGQPAKAGDLAAELFTQLYDELRTMARVQLRRGLRSASLMSTALVNELYLRLAARSELSFFGRRQFMALCAQAMRQILIDRARARSSAKRAGGDAGSLDTWIEQVASDGEASPDFLLDLDAALSRLALEDERLSRVAELRLFGGFSVDETAELLGVSTPTIKRDTQLARAFLLRELGIWTVGSA